MKLDRVSWAILPLIALIGCAQSVHAPAQASNAAVSAAAPQTAPLETAAAVPDTAVASERDELVPLADHHLHLLSVAGAGAKLREILLPPALAKLREARQRNWNNAAALATLFEPKGAMSMGYGWVEGADKAAHDLSGNFTGPYAMKPNVYRVQGATAQVWGFMTESTDMPFGYFHWLLKKNSAGEWRIATETELFPGPALEPPHTAEDLIKDLDAAGIQKGVVLSDAYYFALEPTAMPGEYDKVRAENDWTAEQVERYPNRLVAFCSFNPLRDYALAELERCAASGRFRGIKLHFNAAQINYQDPKQVARARAVIAAANRRHLPLIIHVRSSNSYGEADAKVFLYQLVAAAPDVPVQIAHLWGGESFAPSALKVYADAVASHQPAARKLYFDISGLGYAKPNDIPQIVAAIRRIGVDRILYGSDGPPKEKLKEFLSLPLTDAERRAILHNEAPYLK